MYFQTRRKSWKFQRIPTSPQLGQLRRCLEYQRKVVTGSCGSCWFGWGEDCWFGDHAALRLSDGHHTTLWFWHPLPYVSHNLKLSILAELFGLSFFFTRNYGTNHWRIDFWAGHVPLPQQSSPLDVAAPIWRSSRMIARLKDDMGLTLDVAKRRANKVLTRVYLGGGFTNISIRVLFNTVCNRADFWMIFRAFHFCCEMFLEIGSFLSWKPLWNESLCRDSAPVEVSTGQCFFSIEVTNERNEATAHR